MQEKVGENSASSIKIVNTNEGAVNGQDKCPKCGSTDIEINIQTGNLRCNFCRFEFKPEKVSGLETEISSLEGQVIASGAKDIVADINEVMTFKCSSCGAEVVIDTREAMQARCHWCRHTLSVNEQIPNGSVPDVVLPFHISKEEAKVAIENFVKKRKFFAHPKFKEEFTTANIMGVYFPYMAVDINAHANMSGEAEHTVRKYVRSNTVYYDADLYEVQREFDVAIYGLTIESSSDKLTKKNANKTTNVINSIMPFDIENAVKWNANYLKGYTSERRDMNISALQPIVSNQAKDIARFAANDTLTQYDRGVLWHHENLEVKGSQWKAAYLPVWLYSYQQVQGERKVLHYVAVNARTKETMGSVPIYMPKLFGVSVLVEILGVLAMFMVDFDYSWLFIFSGFIYFFIMFSKYRNQGARHKYEIETKKNVTNLRKVDNYVKRRKNLTNAKIMGANNTSLESDGVGKEILGQLIDQNPIASMIKNNIDKEGK